MSKAALRVLDLHSGTAWTEFAGTAPLLPERFELGGLPQDSDQTSCLRSRLECLAAADAILVVEDDLRRIGDRALQGRQAETLVLDGTLAHWIAVAEAARVDLRRWLSRSASGYPRNAFLLPRSSFKRLRSGDEVADIRIARALERLIALFVSAWDDEGYVWWSGSGPAAFDRAK